MRICLQNVDEPENNVINQCAHFHWGIACSVEQLHNLSFAYSVSNKRSGHSHALCSNFFSLNSCRAKYNNKPEKRENQRIHIQKSQRHQFSSQTHLHHFVKIFFSLSISLRPFDTERIFREHHFRRSSTLQKRKGTKKNLREIDVFTVLCFFFIFSTLVLLLYLFLFFIISF